MSVIDLTEYNEWTKTKRKNSDDLFQDWDNASLGFYGETGELADLVKKTKHHGHKLDDVDPKKGKTYRELILGELGDIVFYSVWLADLVKEVNKWTKGNPVVYYKKGLSFHSVRDSLGHLSLYNYEFISMQRTVDIGNWIIISIHSAINAVEFIGEDLLSVSLMDIIKYNQDKLNKRYPSGFTTEDSLNRKE